MSVKVEHVDNNMAKMTIEVPAARLDEAIEKAYQKQKNTLSLPGFRKGKVPKNMIEKMFGVSIFYEDAANILMQEEYPVAMKESGLDIVSQPTIDIEQIEKGKPFIFTAVVATKPEVKLGEYKGMKVTDIDVSVSAADVNAEIEKEREANARMTTVTDRAIKKGDTAIIDFAGFMDGKQFEGGTATNHALEIGSHSFIDTFEDQLVGKNTGEEVEVNVTFPKDYQAKELAGKPAMFKVKIHEIKVKELPALDDEFAQDVSEFDTLKDYKADLKKKLVEGKKNAAKAAQEDEAIEGVIMNAEMEIPQPMIDFQVDDIINNMSQQMAQQGLTIEQYLQFTGMTEKQLREQAEPEALRRIQASLVLEAVAKDAKIKITEKQIDDEVAKMAEMYHMEIEKINKLIDDDARESIRRDLEVQAAVDLIVKNAVPVPAEEMAKIKEAQEGEEKKPAKKTTVKKTAAKEEDAAKKAPAKKATAKKAADKEETEEKPKAKKTTTKKAADKEEAEKKPAAKKTATAKKTTKKSE
ncbi:MAG: trigger factor [Lachnospiraceae bacterium]|nr:trigger factor [Lachnospiraceae bacterium]